jgi:uncharacterized damage-inducible protein DinB
MREAPAWFSRTFDVPYPVELLPLLLARLRGSPARLEQVTRSCSRARLMAKPHGRWSAQENAGHLFDLEPLWLARVDDYVSGHAGLTAADLTNRKTDDANYNAASLDQILADFRAARETLLVRVEALDASPFVTAIRHPRMGTPMKLADHLSFVAEHDDHHLARIWNLCQ